MTIPVAFSFLIYMAAGVMVLLSLPVFLAQLQEMFIDKKNFYDWKTLDIKVKRLEKQLEHDQSIKTK